MAENFLDREPRIFNTSTIRGWEEEVQMPSGRWVAARSKASGGLQLRWRLRVAWNVFIGKYDAIMWECDALGNDGMM